MANDETEQLLAKISHLLARDSEYPLDGTLLYAEIDQNFVAPAIFKNLADQILYRDPDLRELGDTLLDLWEAQDTDDRWEEIEYVVRDGKFDVAFTYPDEIDREEDRFERRDRVVQRHFGIKPIVYPSLSDESEVPRYEL
ncbi:immunity protein YezG family protein [Sphingomonas sp. M1-B02]|uniref:immunity protein YezG family protein n=1 Tax=Sphingomonas sp. M1-B02 TaxID=3114300 RepID=UPI00223ED4E9|nr:hypothetical protein [Sphingomonas sp. S6-11]UZK65351.1 hypothetical protein OKW87_12630 [Sphingomonas sp. S6-11]